MRRGRRRGRDRPARCELALEQVPEPGHRRRRAADPAPERLQDREPDRARADPRGGARLTLRGLRPPAPARDGRVRRGGSARRARAARRSARRRAGRDRPDPGRRPGGRGGRAAALADARAPHAEGLDGAEGGQRPPGREQLALAPGAAVGRPRSARAARRPGGVAAQLPPRRAVRRGRLARGGARGAAADGRAADERDPARERRRDPARPRPAGLPGLRRRRVEAGQRDDRGDPRARWVPAGRDRGQPPQLPRPGAGRDRLEPARQRLRGHRPGLARRASSRPTRASHPTDG